jgi:hypothetical protein
MSMAWRPDNNHALATLLHSGTVLVWPTDTNEAVALLCKPYSPTSPTTPPTATELCQPLNTARGDVDVHDYPGSNLGCNANLALRLLQKPVLGCRIVTTNTTPATAHRQVTARRPYIAGSAEGVVQ